MGTPIKLPKHYKLINREVSWLSFNARVLQEAEDPTVPLLERLKFLGIFSSNLDEFFRVRVASLRRSATLGLTPPYPSEKPEKVLTQIQDIVLAQQTRFEQIFQSLVTELDQHRIHLINETKLTQPQIQFVKAYFARVVRPTLVPIMLNQIDQMPELKGHAIYQAVSMTKGNRRKVNYALIEIPTDHVNRFVVLPPDREHQYVMLLEDVIRFCLSDIFAIFDFDHFTSFTIKLTRDAEIDIDNDILESYIDKIQKSINQRRHGQPVRFIYEEKMPKDLLQFFIKKLGIHQKESLIPVRRRYHNFKDFMQFPRVGMAPLSYPDLTPTMHPAFIGQSSLLSVISRQDILLHYPYHSFDPIVDILREAAIDPKVESIKMTLYRVAKNSTIINALVNAIRNGKLVTVVIELQARFDEEANIHWSRVLSEEGATIIVGVPQLKVHAKLLLITRRESGKRRHYANLATGNYNETTSRVYTDHSLLTSDKRIAGEVAKLFEFFENNTRLGTYSHLIVSPFSLRKRLLMLINQEIRNARRGIPAKCRIKLNGLTDPKLIGKLYEASAAGVEIELIVRGTCALVSQKKGLSETVRAISIVDQYLEHSRLYIFHNGGDTKVYISSSDWMTRSFDRRIEVACPIYDPQLKAQILKIFEIQTRDNCKARRLSGTQKNEYISSENTDPMRSQSEIKKYLMDLE